MAQKNMSLWFSILQYHHTMMLTVSITLYMEIQVTVTGKCIFSALITNPIPSWRAVGIECRMVNTKYKTHSQEHNFWMDGLYYYRWNYTCTGERNYSPYFDIAKYLGEFENV